MPDLTANTHTELFLKAIAEGSTTPEGLVPENHLELWLQQIMEIGGVSGNYVRYTEQELSAAEEAQARDNIGAAGMEDLAPAYDSTVPYKVGNLLSASGKMYLTIKDAPAGTPVTNTEYFEEKSVSDIIEMIKQGAIVTGHSAVADNLTPYSEDSGTTQENPFISQGTGTDNNSVIVTTGNIAKQLEKQGNTVPVMQLASPLNATYWAGNNASVSFSNDVATLTASAQNGRINQKSGYRLTIAGGHTFFASVKIKTTTATNKIRFVTQGSANIASSVATTEWQTLCGVLTRDSASTDFWFGVQDTRESDWDAIQIKDLIFFDITSWNSSIITDLTAHPEHFSWYYNGSLAYDAGSLQNANGRYLECGQGRNLFDQQTETGMISAETGENEANQGAVRSENYLLIIPNIWYYFKIPTGSSNWFRVCWYDKDKNFISGSQTTTNIHKAPSNAIYVRVCTNGTYGSTYHNDISIENYYTPEQGGEGYGEMHDYIPPIRIDTGNETLNAFDKKLPSGVIKRRTGHATITAVDSGSSLTNVYRGRYSLVGLPLSTTSGQNNLLLQTGATIDGGVVASQGYNPTVLSISTYGGAIDLYICAPSCTTKEQLNAYLAEHPIDIYWPLTDSATTEEQGTPYSEYANINDYSYMCWIDADGNLVSIHQGCKLFYPVDYKGFLDDGVMYTNGDFTALAKNEDITDSALNARGYYKLQVLLSSLTDAAGLTYDIEEAMKIGNLVSLTIRATNLEETSISSGDPLFTLASDLIPAGTIKAYANVAGSVVSCTISNLGSVSVDAAIAQNETVAIILTYAV